MGTTNYIWVLSYYIWGYKKQYLISKWLTIGVLRVVLMSSDLRNIFSSRKLWYAKLRKISALSEKEVLVVILWKDIWTQKIQRFRSGFGFSIFLVFGFGYFANLLQISNKIIYNTKKSSFTIWFWVLILKIRIKIKIDTQIHTQKHNFLFQIILFEI